MKTNGPNGLCKSASLCVELTVFSSTSQNLLLILSSNKKGRGERSVLIAVIHTSVKISAWNFIILSVGIRWLDPSFFPLLFPLLLLWRPWMIILMVSMIIIVAGVCNSYWHHLDKLILIVLFGDQECPKPRILIGSSDVFPQSLPSFWSCLSLSF